jgi:hypothetical protein
MNYKSILTTSLIVLAGHAQAEISINDFLSFEGFVDMSYAHSSSDNSVYDNESENSFSVDQVEIAWLFDFNPVTARIDLEHDGADSSEGSAIDQAFVTYTNDNGWSVAAGYIDSMLGFEAFEPTGLYQYSYAYDLSIGIPTYGEDLVVASLLPGTNEAVRIRYEQDGFFIAGSVQDGVYDGDGRLGGDDDSNYGLELAGGIDFENGLSYFLGAAYEDFSDESEDSWILNTYLVYETGAWVLAAEFNYADSDLDIYDIDSPDVEHYSGLLMANYAYSEQASITGRVSYVDVESYYADFDFWKFTLAHGYAFTDNLMLVAEISYVDGEFKDVDLASYDFDQVIGAVELLFSF